MSRGEGRALLPRDHHQCEPCRQQLCFPTPVCFQESVSVRRELKLKKQEEVAMRRLFLRQTRVLPSEVAPSDSTFRWRCVTSQRPL